MPKTKLIDDWEYDEEPLEDFPSIDETLLSPNLGLKFPKPLIGTPWIDDIGEFVDSASEIDPEVE